MINVDCGLLINILAQKGGTRGALLTQLEAILAGRVTPEKGQHCPDEADLHLCILDLRSERPRRKTAARRHVNGAPWGCVTGCPGQCQVTQIPANCCLTPSPFNSLWCTKELPPNHPDIQAGTCQQS